MLNLFLAVDLSKETYLYCLIGAIAAVFIILVIYFSVRAAKYRKSVKAVKNETAPAKSNIIAEEEFIDIIEEESADLQPLQLAFEEEIVDEEIIEEMDSSYLIAAELAAEELKKQQEVKKVEAAVASFAAAAPTAVITESVKPEIDEPVKKPIVDIIIEASVEAIKEPVKEMTKDTKLSENQKLIMVLKKLEDDVLAYKAELDVFCGDADLNRLNAFETELYLLESVLKSSPKIDSEQLLSFSLRKYYIQELISVMATPMDTQPAAKQRFEEVQPVDNFEKLEAELESFVSLAPKQEQTNQNIAAPVSQPVIKAPAAIEPVYHAPAVVESVYQAPIAANVQPVAEDQPQAQPASKNQLDPTVAAQQMIDDYTAKIQKTFETLNTSSKIALRKAQLTNILTDLKLASSFSQVKEISNRFYILQATLDSEEVLNTELTTLINSTRLEILRTADENYYTLLQRRAATKSRPASQRPERTERPTRPSRPQRRAAPSGLQRPAADNRRIQSQAEEQQNLKSQQEESFDGALEDTNE